MSPLLEEDSAGGAGNALIREKTYHGWRNVSTATHNNMSAPAGVLIVWDLAGVEVEVHLSSLTSLYSSVKQINEGSVLTVLLSVHHDFL